MIWRNGKKLMKIKNYLNLKFMKTTEARWITFNFYFLDD